MSDYARNKFIAPELSLFTEATIPDVADKAEDHAHNLAAFILNATLRGGVTVLGLQMFFNAIRRTNSAFVAYGRGRDLTLRYLEDPHERVLIYVESIEAWEATLGYTWQAAQLIATGDKRFWFKPGDGSTFERLNDLHNTAKHADERIAAGTLHAESPIGVWLTNDGLKSRTTHLTFAELAEVLDLLRRFSSIARDPVTMTENLAKWVEEVGERPEGQ